MSFESIVQEARQHHDVFSQDDREQLVAGQKPDVLFIGCSDSRVIPSRITGTGPGELFELRTAGNVVPEYDPNAASSEMGTIEYAVLQLRVPEIVVCGHSHCGAVTALSIAGRGLGELPALCTWLGTDQRTGADSVADPAVRAESKEHVRDQLAALRRYPFIQDRVQRGDLRLHGWFYEIDTGLVERAPEDPTAEFLPL